MKALVPALFLFASCTLTPAPVPASRARPEPVGAMKSPDSAATVRPGIEVFLSDLPAALRGKRVGLITNHTGIDRSRTSDIDLIAQHKDLKLVALLAPEHGIRGDAAAGVKIEAADFHESRKPFLLYR